jgi:hypothetical protein
MGHSQARTSGSPTLDTDLDLLRGEVGRTLEAFGVQEPQRGAAVRRQRTPDRYRAGGRFPEINGHQNGAWAPGHACLMRRWVR